MFGRIRFIQNGVSRDCLLISEYAIKFPSLRNGWYYFFNGILSNYREASHWHSSKHPRLARHIWLSPMGLISVYQRYNKMMPERSLTALEVQTLPIYNADTKHENYALDENNKLIVLDYGHCDCYIKYTEDELEHLDEEFL